MGVHKKEFDFVEYWANYCVEHPEDARRQNVRFINSIFEKHYAWRDTMLLKPNGVELLAELYNVKNKNILKAWRKRAKMLRKNKEK